MLRRVLLLSSLVVFTALHACSSSSPTMTTPGSDAGHDPVDHPPEAAPPPPSKLNTTTEAIDVDGTPRQYVLSVPKTYDSTRKYPLILVLHGDGQHAVDFVSFSKLEDATGEDAILAYSEGSEDIFTPYDDNVDERLIEVMITTVKGKLSVDPLKIWGFGYSKGAFQLNELACRKPGLFTAMALHAGGAPQERLENGDVDCPAAVGLPVFVEHGALDEIEGGEFEADYWAEKAGCQTTRSASTPAICEAYDGCEAGKPVVFCTVPNHGHYPLYENAAADSWAWFQKLWRNRKL